MASQRRNHRFIRRGSWLRDRVGPSESRALPANRGRRLLFVSNYDGSWDSYLDDFTLKAAGGLTLAWAHSIGFPRSRLMYWGGAAQGPEFIDWSRRSMVPTLVWYSAYPGLSVANINRNTRLRKAIAADKNGENKENWLGWV